MVQNFHRIDVVLLGLCSLKHGVCVSMLFVFISLRVGAIIDFQLFLPPHFQTVVCKGGGVKNMGN